MATAVPAAPYDDGSSTESEYYFDPREEAEEKAAYAWTHERDVQPVNQPSTDDSTVIKQEYSSYGQLQQDAEEIALPQGSEWSHGGTNTVHNNAVEQALAMAQDLTNAERKEPLTDDTMNSTSSNMENKETMNTVVLKKSEEVKVKPKIISLKSVKASTLPASITKSVAVGLRRSQTNVVGEPSEMHKELSVARPQWKATGSQYSSQENPSQIKKTHSKLSGIKESSMKQIGRNKSQSMKKSEPDKVSSSRRTEHNKLRERNRSPSVHRRRSPSIHQAERSGREGRSPSPVRYSSRRSRSRSPRVREKHARSRSKPPYRPSTDSQHSRSYRYIERVSSPRHNDDSDRQHSHTYKQSRSPSKPSRIHTRLRSRSRSRDRYDRRHEIRRDRNERKSDGQLNDKRETVRRESASTSRDKSSAVNHFSTNRSASKPRLQDSELHQSRRSKSYNVVVSSIKPITVEPSKTSSRNPHIRPQVDSRVASHDDRSFKKHGHVYHDAFERRVFKLKLQEADVDEKIAVGPLSGKEIWFYDQRRQKMAAERASLEAEHLDRFEKLYKSMQVSDFDLKKYQTQRDFAARVVRFKREQASLREQKSLFLSSEVQDQLWRRLDKEREALIAENPFMFQKVMMDTMPSSAAVNGKITDDSVKFASTQPSRKRAHGTDNHRGQLQFKRRPPDTIPMNRQRYSTSSSASSRIVVGASLQLQDDDDVDNFKIPPAMSGNTSWFLKG